MIRGYQSRVVLSRVRRLAVEAESQGYPGYFRAMRSLAAGPCLHLGRQRTFAAGAIISRTAAELYWPNEDPIGKRVSIYDGDEQGPVWQQVVGIVGDIH